MPEVSRTDLRTLCRYLTDAAAHYEQTAGRSTRLADRARLLRNMERKLARKLPIQELP